MKSTPAPHESDQQLREEVERLRRRLSELESSLEESQRTVNSLQKSEQWRLEDIYRRAINAAGAVPYLISHDGPWKYNYIGEGIHSLTGYSAEEMTAEIWDSLCLEAVPRGRLASLTFEEADRLTNEDNSVLWECDFHIRARDGQARWIADTSVKNFDEKSGRLISVGIYQDITEHRLSEIARQRAEDLYRRAIVSAGAVPYALDHSTNKILFIGEGILAMTGYSASEMMDSNRWNSVVEEGFPRGNLAHLTFEEADRLTDMNHSIPWECDFRIRTRDGQIRWVADTSVKSHDKNSDHLISIGIKQDITERKHAEELQEELIHELERRNAELERLAYTLSHELKSPLITIRGFLGYLREDAISGNVNRLERDLQRITDGAEKMLRLINELIELMSIGRISHDFEEIPLRVLVDEAIELIHEKIAYKKAMVLIADNLSPIYGDHKMLVEVFQNLLENAVKFMGEQPEPKIEIGQRYKEGGIPTFYVRDNGIGIDPRFADRIFGIFHKLDALSEGEGIGLALVKRIIEVHGGKIWVESEGAGKGSTFCFAIPDRRKKNAPELA